MRRVLWLAVLLAGCVSPTPAPGPGEQGDAIYETPDGAVWHCENPGLSAAVRGGINAIMAYSTCKDTAEWKGWRRRRDLDGSRP